MHKISKKIHSPHLKNGLFIRIITPLFCFINLRAYDVKIIVGKSSITNIYINLYAIVNVWCMGYGIYILWVRISDYNKWTHYAIIK